MNSSLHSWAGQVTTGHGVMILGSTMLAIVSGSLAWETAIPLLVAGVIGLLWPENAAAGTAGEAIGTDVEALIAAYRTGLGHAGSVQAQTGSVPVVPANRAAAAATGLATLAITAAALGACANETPAQQQAEISAITSGLVCVADTTGKVVTAASTKDADAVRTVNAVVAAGGGLTTDAACQAAIASGVAAAAPVPQPAPVTAKP